MRFTKMQGCGNDYIYVNAMEERVESPGRLAKAVSDRHFGIGAPFNAVRRYYIGGRRASVDTDDLLPASQKAFAEFAHNGCLRTAA